MTRPVGVDIDRLRQLWREGVPNKAIAAELGISRPYVSTLGQRLGLPRRVRGGRVMEACQPRRVDEAPPIVPGADVPRPPVWSVERDGAILATRGAYAELQALARDWGIASARIVARWHLLRAG